MSNPAKIHPERSGLAPWRGSGGPLAVMLALVPPALPAQQPDILFGDVTLIPLGRQQVVKRQSVLIRDGRIAAIGPASKLTGSGAAIRIDGRGKFLMPGLADMHVHLFNSRDLLLYVANGVTTIRNLGGYGSADSILEIRRQVAAGDRPGPAIYTSGNWLDGDPPYRAIDTVVRTPAEARAEVTRQAAAGYDFIKVYANLAPDVYREIAGTARAHGIPVTGHVPGPVGLDLVLASGQAAIDHAAQLGGDPRLLAKALDRSDVSVTTALVMLRLSLLLRGAPEQMEELLSRPEARLVSPATRRFWRESPFVGMPRAAAWALQVGNRADLLLLEGNPLEDVANLRRRSGVMVRGEWLPAGRLDRLLDELAGEYAAESAP